MKINKCTKIALAILEKNNQWLADKLDMSKQHISALLRQESVTSKTFEKLATVFNMTPSKFIALSDLELETISLKKLTCKNKGKKNRVKK